MDMNKTNHWLSLVANFGVIAGVIFLAYELQQNNELLVQESRYSMLQNQKDWTVIIAADPEVARLIYNANPVDLTELEKNRRFDILGGHLLTWQWEWEQSESGAFGDSKLPVEAFRIGWNLYNLAAEWPRLKSMFDPRFAEFIENEVTN